MLSVSLAICRAGRYSVARHSRFGDCVSTLQRLPACQTTRGRSARDNLSLARIEFRSPDFPGGVYDPGLSLRATAPNPRLEPFGFDFQPRPFPESGLVTAGNPFSKPEPDAFRLFPFRCSPLGLSSLRILALRRSLPLPATNAPGWKLAQEPAVLKRPITPHSPSN